VLAIPTLLMEARFQPPRVRSKRIVIKVVEAWRILYGFNALGAGPRLPARRVRDARAVRHARDLVDGLHRKPHRPLLARVVADSLPRELAASAPAAVQQQAVAPGQFVLVASGVVGFAFFA